MRTTLPPKRQSRQSGQVPRAEPPRGKRLGWKAHLLAELILARLFLAGFGGFALGAVFLDFRLGDVLVLRTDHAENRGSDARATRHWTELLGTAPNRSRRRGSCGHKGSRWTAATSGWRGTACEGGGDSLLNAADTIGLDSGHNLIDEPFDQ
jgi:hypothetical protein